MSYMTFSQRLDVKSRTWRAHFLPFAVFPDGQDLIEHVLGSRNIAHYSPREEMEYVCSVCLFVC